MMHLNATLECNECGKVGYCRLEYVPGTHKAHTLSMPSFVVKDAPHGWVHGEHLDFCSRFCETEYFNVDGLPV